jgi:hypothetical protein
VKVGKYDVPTYRLHPYLVEATKKLFENFKFEEAPNSLTVAQLLDHKTDKSGGFLTKIADMRSYGLITSRGIKVTDLGRRLTYGETDEEKNAAYKEAVLSIPLWKELYSRFGKTLPTSNFWAQLGKIAGLEAPDAQKAEENVKKAYLDDFQYVKEEKKPDKEGLGTEPSDKVDTSPAIIEVKVGGYYQKLPYNEDGIKLAKGFLELLEGQLKAKTKPKPSKEEG